MSGKLHKSMLLSITCDPKNQDKCSQELEGYITKGFWVQLIAKDIKQETINKNYLPEEAGVILKGGGSSGYHQLCLLSSSHLNQSALSTSAWIEEQGLSPNTCLILNALPLHHVSGLMPWWRSRCWKAKHVWLHPQLMHDPQKLESKCQSLINSHKGPVLTLSLIHI